MDPTVRPPPVRGHPRSDPRRSAGLPQLDCADYRSDPVATADTAAPRSGWLVPGEDDLVQDRRRHSLLSGATIRARSSYGAESALLPDEPPAGRVDHEGVHRTFADPPITLIPIVLAEPHPIAREALSTLLQENGELGVVASADLAGALRAVAEHRAPLLIVARGLLERGPDGLSPLGPRAATTRTIVLGLQDDPAFGREARRAGAAAYVVKDRADSELLAQVDAQLVVAGLRTSWPLSA
jgi:CheY-like chemotaxis protein